MRAREHERRRYYRAAADHWRAVVDLQVQRLKELEAQPLVTGIATRADMDFYVVAVQRLREVARMARDRLPNSGPVRQAIDEFDRRWPGFRRVRDYAEHVLGPGGTVSGGAWYFRDSIMAPGPAGEATYLVQIRNTTASADELYRAICDFVGDFPEE